METVSKLVRLIDFLLVFVLIAFVWTAAVSLGSRAHARAKFRSLFAVTCIILLILMVIGRSVD